MKTAAGRLLRSGHFPGAGRKQDDVAMGRAEVGIPIPFRVKGSGRHSLKHVPWLQTALDTSLSRIATDPGIRVLPSAQFCEVLPVTPNKPAAICCDMPSSRRAARY